MSFSLDIQLQKYPMRHKIAERGVLKGLVTEMINIPYEKSDYSTQNAVS
jgi:hypothetical protein